VLKKLEAIQQSFKGKVSLADLIVLGGGCGREGAAAGVNVKVPFQRTRGRLAGSDRCRFVRPARATRGRFPQLRQRQEDAVHEAEEALVDRAALLRLTGPEMTVLVGGLRVLGANAGRKHGVFTKIVGTLTNDFFVNLLDMGTEWKPAGDNLFEGAIARPRP
jgi:catalase-peroxidase